MYPTYIYVKQIPKKITTEDRSKVIENKAAVREKQILKLLMTDNRASSIRCFNPLIDTIEGKEDTWFIFEHIYATPKSLRHGGSQIDK